MSQNDFTEQLEEWIVEAKARKPTKPKLAASAEEIISYFKGEIRNVTPPPSWYDIYRYAKDESEWYEKERTRLVSDGAKVDAIKEAVRQINFFEDIRGIADLQMMNACLQIARANEIVNPFDDFYDQPENHSDLGAVAFKNK